MAQVGRELEEAMTIKAHSLAEQVARYGSSALDDQGAMLRGLLSSAPRAAKPAAAAAAPAPAAAALSLPLAAAAAAASPALAMAGPVAYDDEQVAAAAAAAANGLAAAAAPAALLAASGRLAEPQQPLQQSVSSSTPAPPDTLPSMAEAQPSPRVWAAEGGPMRRSGSGGSLSSLDPQSALLTEEEQRLVAAAAGRGGNGSGSGAASSFSSVSTAEEAKEETEERAVQAEGAVEAAPAWASVAEAEAAALAVSSRVAMAGSARGGGGAARIAATATASMEVRWGRRSCVRWSGGAARSVRVREANARVSVSAWWCRGVSWQVCDEDGLCVTEEVAGLVLVDAGLQQEQRQQQQQVRTRSVSPCRRPALRERTRVSRPLHVERLLYSPRRGALRLAAAPQQCCRDAHPMPWCVPSVRALVRPQTSSAQGPGEAAPRRAGTRRISPSAARQQRQQQRQRQRQRAPQGSGGEEEEEEQQDGDAAAAAAAAALAESATGERAREAEVVVQEPVSVSGGRP